MPVFADTGKVIKLGVVEMFKYLVLGISLSFCVDLYSMPSTSFEESAKMEKPGKLYAKKRKSRKSRKKILSQEGRSRKKKSRRGGGSTNIDFSEASIDGARRTPAGVALSTTKQNQDFDLIKLRTRWHDQMKLSTTNLETGRGR